MPLERKGKLSNTDLDAIGLHGVSGWSAAVVFGDTLALRIQLARGEENSRKSASDEPLQEAVQIALSPSQADALVERLLLFLAEAGSQKRPAN